jgi:hypothetical protein
MDENLARAPIPVTIAHGDFMDNIPRGGQPDEKPLPIPIARNIGIPKRKYFLVNTI